MLEILKDLTFINAVIATELLRITENTAIIAGKPPQKVDQCSLEHQEIETNILKILEKYGSSSALKSLKNHLMKH